MKTSKKTEILDCAQELIQKRGYNAFSYADISNLIGIQKASIHHYFPTKTDLGIAVIERYRELFNEALYEIDYKKNWDSKIRHYASLYKKVLSEDKLCLCGMLASDMETLDPKLKSVVKLFFLDNIKWLTKVLASEYPLLSDELILSTAWNIIYSLQGATMISRIMNDLKFFEANCETLLQQLRHIQ